MNPKLLDVELMLVDHYGGEIQNSIFIWSLIIFSPQCECNKLKTTTVDVLIHVVSNPVDEVADLRVDAGVEQTPTADAPADNPPEVALAVLAVADHGAPAVSLACILPRAGSADHVGGDVTGGVGRVRAGAPGVGHGVHINLGK